MYIYMNLCYNCKDNAFIFHKATYSCGPLYMDEQMQDDWLDPIYNCSVPIQYVAMKTSRERWTIETGSDRGSVRSVLATRHDDDDICICRSYIDACLSSRILVHL